MAKSHTHKVAAQNVPQRLQEYGVGLFELIPTKSALKKALKKDQIEVDGKKATTATMITGGETIIFTPADYNEANKRLDLNLEVLFEDEYLAAIYKPAGILVSGNKLKTITNALPKALRKSECRDAVMPQPAHRLGFGTSGGLFVGQTFWRNRRLNRLF